MCNNGVIGGEVINLLPINGGLICAVVIPVPIIKPSTCLHMRLFNENSLCPTKLCLNGSNAWLPLVTVCELIITKRIDPVELDWVTFRQ